MEGGLFETQATSPSLTFSPLPNFTYLQINPTFPRLPPDNFVFFPLKELWLNLTSHFKNRTGLITSNVRRTKGRFLRRFAWSYTHSVSISTFQTIRSITRILRGIPGKLSNFVLRIAFPVWISFRLVILKSIVDWIHPIPSTPQILVI